MKTLPNRAIFLTPKIPNRTSYAKRGEKWRDTVLDVALKDLVESPEYKKRNGDLNFSKLKTLLGVDQKTIKGRLEGIGVDNFT